MRLVLDTNVVLSALLWRGTPYQLLTNIRDQAESISLACSAPLLAELADVLTPPPATVRLALIQRSAADVLADYTAVVEIVTPLPVPRIAPDPDDDVVIGTALAAKADWVITGDKPLLSVTEYQGVRIVSVGQTVQMVGALP
jgi:putative PIN family toxin of toxin-antitoxin system